MKIPAQRHQIPILVHNDPFKPTLKEMATPLMFSVNVNGIARVNVLHDLGEVGLRGLD